MKKSQLMLKIQNSIEVFENPIFGQIRMVMVDDEPWFVGKDICEVFGDTNYRRSLSNIDDSDKGGFSRPVRAEQSIYRPFRYAQAHIVESNMTGIAFANVSYFKYIVHISMI